MAGTLALGGMVRPVLGTDAGARQPRSPNILFIVTDQERCAATLPERMILPKSDSSPNALADYGFDSYQAFGDHSGFEGTTGRDGALRHPCQSAGTTPPGA